MLKVIKEICLSYMRVTQAVLGQVTKSRFKKNSVGQNVNLKHQHDILKQLKYSCFWYHHTICTDGRHLAWEQFYVEKILRVRLAQPQCEPGLWILGYEEWDLMAPSNSTGQTTSGICGSWSGVLAEGGQIPFPRHPFPTSHDCWLLTAPSRTLLLRTPYNGNRNHFPQEGCS